MRSAASRRRITVGTPCSSATLAEVDVVREQPELEPARERDELRVDLVDLGHLVVEHEDARRRLALEHLEDLEAALRAARALVVRVGEALQLVEHEARHAGGRRGTGRSASSGSSWPSMTADESTRKPSVSSYGRARTSGRRREAGHREQLFALAAPRRGSRGTSRARRRVRRRRSRSRPVARAARAAPRSSRPKTAPMPPPTMPASTCGSGTRSTRRSTTPTARSSKRPRTPPPR